MWRLISLKSCSYSQTRKSCWMMLRSRTALAAMSMRLEFQILRGVSKTKNRITAVDFRCADFRSLLGKSCGKLPWRAEAQKSWLIFKDNLLRAQEQSTAMLRQLGKCGRRPEWMNMELLSELKYKKEAYRRWKLGSATWNEHKDIPWTCRNEVRKAKAHLELKQVWEVKGNEKRFCKYINNKRKAKMSVGPLLRGPSDWWQEM